MNDKEKDIAKENMESRDGGEKNYEFITETIKRRPVNKKRIFGKVALTVFMAFLFGVIASLTIAFMLPQIADRMNTNAESEQTKPVTLPVAEEIQEEPVEEFVPSQEEDEEPVKEDITEDPEQEENESVDEMVPEDDKSQEVVINQVVETIEKELELDDYRALYRKISAVGNSVQKCLVKVSGLSSETDWFNNQYEDNDSASGVIVADNGKELLIVCLSDIFDNAEEVEVTFCDGNTYKSSIKDDDYVTGLSIVAVELNDISESTMGKIEMASFGSISSMMLGTPVLAVGSPQGVPDSMALGQITSSHVSEIIDGNLKILSTDIYGSTYATGVISNLNGRIVGLICNEMTTSDVPNLIRAYSILDIKDKIEKMSNGQELAMLGIIGTDVTESAYNDLGVPFGAYVKKVDMDSPAMTAGIRSGDVIVKIGTSDINSFADFKDTMLKAQAGDVVVVKVMRPGREKYFEVTYEVTLGSL